MDDLDRMHALLLNPIQARLKFILEQYHEAREKDQVLDTQHRMWQTFATLGEALLASEPIQRRQPHLRVRWSLGKGNWARVPWVALLDSRETTTTQHGIYVVWLFCEDMSGVYLTLNQGVTEFKGARRREQLRGRAHRLRGATYARALTDAGFALDDSITLHTEASLGRDYEFGTIAHRFFATKQVPPDNELRRALEECLRAYDGYLRDSSRHIPEAGPGSETVTGDSGPENEAEGISGAPLPTPEHDAPHIFVSHSHTDLEYCRAFVNGLRAHGIDVWYDEHNLGSGQLRQVIVREMEARPHFVVILSEAAVASEWVNREINAALDLDDEGSIKTLLPVIAGRCRIPLMLRGYKRLEGVDGAPLAVDEAVARCLRVLTS